MDFLSLLDSAPKNISIYDSLLKARSMRRVLGASYDYRRRYGEYKDAEKSRRKSNV